MIKTQRIYEEIKNDRSIRVLIDRLWPRGISKEKANIDHWFRDLAPSDELRKWYQHDHDKWDEFSMRYEKELNQNEPRILELLQLIESNSVTFLFASRETEKNNATALRSYLEGLIDQ